MALGLAGFGPPPMGGVSDQYPPAGLGPISAPPGDYFPDVRRAAISAFGGAGHNGDNRIRTGDPLLAKQVLYQLS